MKRSRAATQRILWGWAVNLGPRSEAMQILSLRDVVQRSALLLYICIIEYSHLHEITFADRNLCQRLVLQTTNLCLPAQSSCSAIYIFKICGKKVIKCAVEGKKCEFFLLSFQKWFNFAKYNSCAYTKTSENKRKGHKTKPSKQLIYKQLNILFTNHFLCGYLNHL